MSEATSDPLEDVIRAAGEGWLIDWYRPKPNAMPHLRKILGDADQWARQRFAGGAPALTPESVVAEYARNPHKVRAFLQATGSVTTPSFLVMVWRILQGMSIQSVRMEYEHDKRFSLHVRLSSPYGESEEYMSSEIEDAVVLRHLGTMRMGDQGIFDGFYALNVGVK